MASTESEQQLELDRIEAKLDAEHQAVEQAALEQGDTKLPDPPADGGEPPLPDGPPPIEVTITPPPAIDEPGQAAAEQEGEPGELTDDEVALLFGAEELDPAAAQVEDDEGYDPRTAKPAGFC